MQVQNREYNTWSVVQLTLAIPGRTVLESSQYEQILEFCLNFACKREPAVPDGSQYRNFLQKFWPSGTAMANCMRGWMHRERKYPCCSTSLSTSSIETL